MVLEVRIVGIEDIEKTNGIYKLLAFFSAVCTFALFLSVYLVFAFFFGLITLVFFIQQKHYSNQLFILKHLGSKKNESG